MPARCPHVHPAMFTLPPKQVRTRFSGCVPIVKWRLTVLPPLVPQPWRREKKSSEKKKCWEEQRQAGPRGGSTPAAPWVGVGGREKLDPDVRVPCALHGAVRGLFFLITWSDWTAVASLRYHPVWDVGWGELCPQKIYTGAVALSTSV